MKAEKYEICEMQSARAVHRNGDGWKRDRHVGRSSSGIHSWIWMIFRLVETNFTRKLILIGRYIRANAKETWW